MGKGKRVKRLFTTNCQEENLFKDHLDSASNFSEDIEKNPSNEEASNSNEGSGLQNDTLKKQKQLEKDNLRLQKQ